MADQKTSGRNRLRNLFLGLAMLFPSLLIAQEATMSHFGTPQPAQTEKSPEVTTATTVPTPIPASNPTSIPATVPTPTPIVPEKSLRTGELSSLVPQNFFPGIEFLRKPEGLISSLQLMLVMTVLALAPSIMIMTTSYIRIMTVLSVLRQALGTNQLPPNQVITALSLFLTLLIMMPVWSTVYTEAVQPFSQQKIDVKTAWERGEVPIREFMAKQIIRCGNTDDILVFLPYIKDYKVPEKMTWRDIPWRALLPAYMLSELKTAFFIGFMIYLPFLVLDMVVAAVMVSMGMMMLPPTIVSLPFKLMLFVLVNGWQLVVVMLLESFDHYAPAETVFMTVRTITGFC